MNSQLTLIRSFSAFLAAVSFQPSRLFLIRLFIRYRYRHEDHRGLLKGASPGQGSIFHLSQRESSWVNREVCSFAQQ